mgnify:CR=1 FL=1
MFVIFATKPLNDGTKGFRFNFFGYHFGKRTLYVEHAYSRKKLFHFAG